MVRGVYGTDGVANGRPLRWPVVSRPVVGEEPGFVFERICCYDFWALVSIEICRDKRVHICPAAIRLRNGEVPFAIPLEHRNQIASLCTCLRIVHAWVECRRGYDIQMAVAVHINHLNRRVEITHHRGGVGVLREVAIACTIGYRE